MSEDPVAELEGRLLILAPIGKDAALGAAKLATAGIQCRVCGSLGEMAQEIQHGAAGALIAEEALVHGAESIPSVLAGQPAWSDLPVLILTRPGADSETVALALRTLGNVTLLERPIRVATLISAAKTALRARQRQYESRAQLQSLEVADRRKDEFLATLAHELRNPLAPIRNAVELMRRRSADASASDQLTEMIARQVAHMVRLVDDLLEISRITRGTVELRPRPIELASVIAAAVETSRPLIDAGDHTLEISLPPEEIWIEADATRLAQVFSNLLNNASKYSDERGRISISAGLDKGEVEIRVRDSGIGITSSLLPRVFDMFTQGARSNTRAPGGLGIGLTLARSLIEMHGGSVSAQSDGPGEGSVFIVRLPRCTGDAVSVTLPEPLTVKAPLPFPRVLVVDDNADAADSLGALLELMGAAVVIAHDGESALRVLEGQRHDVAFLDLGMPKMDGYELARQIRERPNARNLLLVALTGWGQDQDRDRSMEAGFDRHMVKPADIRELEAVLHSAVAPASNPH